MKQIGRAAAAAVLALASVASVIDPAGAADTGADEIAFATRVNEFRAAHRLRPLAIRGELFDVARAWSRRMAATGRLAHNPALARQAPREWVRLGEIVGTGGDVHSIFEAFLASPHHRRLIADPAFDSIGVGEVENARGLHVTVDFMTVRR